jgi:hypothetical protein
MNPRTYFESRSHSLNSANEASNCLVVLILRLVKRSHQMVLLRAVHATQLNQSVSKMTRNSNEDRAEDLLESPSIPTPNSRLGNNHS